jgi:hypothetical protein
LKKPQAGIHAEQLAAFDSLVMKPAPPPYGKLITRRTRKSELSVP